MNEMHADAVAMKRERRMHRFVYYNSLYNGRQVASISYDIHQWLNGNPDRGSGYCITNAFVLRCASRAACSVRPSVAIRGLPQDVAVPSRCPRRDSPKNVNI